MGIMKKNLVQGMLVLGSIFVASCTSIMGPESSRENVVIQDHSLSGSGANAVMNIANTYCGQYGGKAVLRNKVDASFGRSEYDYYYYDCLKEQPKMGIAQPDTSKPATPKVSIEAAKEKCQSLGVKDSTEEFGKCVLLISR